MQKTTASAASPSTQHVAWILVGPTASGKTAVAAELARRLGADILSADSMLVYRGMDIGTAKPTAAEREGIAMHGIDLVEPGERFSVGAWLEEAARAFRTGRDLIVAGGTGLYINALLHGIDAPAASAPQREKTAALYAGGGVEALQRRAEELAPGSVATLPDPLNPRRLMRLVEKLASGGATAPAQPGMRMHDHVIAGLQFPSAALSRRIDERIRRMFEGGLLKEVEGLCNASSGFSQTAGQGIGYAEAMLVLDGTITPDEAVERIAARTRRLAKRQRTWFRHQLEVEWVQGPDGEHDIQRAADDVMEVWKRHGKTPVSV